MTGPIHETSACELFGHIYVDFDEPIQLDRCRECGEERPA